MNKVEKPDRQFMNVQRNEDKQYQFQNVRRNNHGHKFNNVRENRRTDAKVEGIRKYNRPQINWIPKEESCPAVPEPIQRPNRRQQTKPARTCNRKPERTCNRQPDRSYERKSTRTYEEQPERTYERKPTRTYEEQPERTYERRPTRTYERRPTRTYERRPTRTYESQPTRTYESKPTRTYNRKPEKTCNRKSPPSWKKPIDVEVKVVPERRRSSPPQRRGPPPRYTAPESTEEYEYEYEGDNDYKPPVNVQVIKRYNRGPPSKWTPRAHRGEKRSDWTLPPGVEYNEFKGSSRVIDPEVYQSSQKNSYVYIGNNYE
jgi:hypothetical protein